MYQRQWRKSAVNIASIQNYLVCLHSLITCSESRSSSPGGLDGKESACNAGELGSISGLGRSPEEERLPTPEFWPGEFQGGRKELDTTERIPLSLSYKFPRTGKINL